MTANKTKAVLLAALMVLSVLSVAGMASAATTTDVSLDRQGTGDVTAGDTVTYDVVLGTADSGVGAFDNITVSANDTGVAEITSISTNVADGANTGVADDGSSAYVNVPFGGDTANTGSVVIATVEMSAVADGDVALDLTVTGDISDEAGSLYTINNVNDATLSVGTTDGGDGDTGDGDETETTADRTFTSASDLYGSLVYAGQSVSVDVSGTTLADGDDVQLRQVTGDDSSNPVATLTVTNGSVEFDTADRPTGDYFLRAGDQLTRSNTEFEIVEMDLSASFEDEEVGNAGTTTNDLSISSDLRNDYDVTIFVDGFGESDYEDVFGADAGDIYQNDDGDYEIEITDAEAVHTLDFDGIDADNYDFEVSVTDTDSTDTANVTVTDVSAGELDFTSSTYEGQQGDLLPVTVEFTGAADSGTLLIGNEADDGYQANVSIDANGEDEVTVLFNTYTAGDADAEADLVTVEGDSDAEITAVDDQTALSDILDTGDYELAVSVEDAAEAEDNPDALATMFVDARSTDNMNLWRAPTSVAEDIESVSDVSDGVDDGTVTETEMVTGEDALIAQVDVTGLNGLLEAHGADVDDSELVTDAFFSAFDADDGLYLEVEQQNPDSNKDAAYLNLSASSDDVTVLASADGDELYVIVDMSSENLVFENEDGVEMADYELADGDEFEATYTVSDDRLLDSEDSDDHQDVASAFTFDEAEFEWTEDPYDLANVEDAEVTAESNVAPGNEFSVRIRGSGDARFYQTVEELVLSSEGTVTATFDLSDRAIDEAYDLTLRYEGDEVDSVSGTIVEAAPETTTTTEPTTTEPTTTEPTTTEPTTTEPTTTEETTTEETTTTSQETPGFGIAVAMLALIGAALIALRRRN